MTIGVGSKGMLFATTNAGSYGGVAYLPSTNAMAVCVVAVGGSNSVGSMSGGQNTWLQLSRSTYNGAGDTIYVFVQQGSPTPTSMQPQFFCSDNAGTGCCIMQFEVTSQEGMYFRQCVASFGTTANPTVTFPFATNSANAVIVGIGIDRTNPAMTPPASWTETCDSGYATPTAGMAVAFRAQAVNTTTITYSGAVGNWGAVGIEIWQLGSVPPNLDDAGMMGLIGVGV